MFNLLKYIIHYIPINNLKKQFRAFLTYLNILKLNLCFKLQTVASFRKKHNCECLTLFRNAIANFCRWVKEKQFLEQVQFIIAIMRFIDFFVKATCFKRWYILYIKKQKYLVLKLYNDFKSYYDIFYNVFTYLKSRFSQA